MSESVKRSYDQVMARLGSSFDELNWESRDVYLSWMAQVHYIVMHSTRLLALAAAHTDLDRNDIHQRFVRHAAEEMGHDVLAKRDVQFLKADVHSLPVLDGTKALVQYQYDAVTKISALSFYGYILLLEGLAITKGPMLSAVAERCYGAKATSFLKVHVEEDEDHVEKAFAQLAKWSPEEHALVSRALEESADLYDAMLSSLKSHCEGSATYVSTSEPIAVS